MTTRAKPVDESYVRMYYEHQYERMAEQEHYRLTMTNYVRTLSALANELYFAYPYDTLEQESL